MFLLFDLDGTLTDSNGLWLDVDIEFTRRRGLTVTQEYTDFVTHAIFPTSAQFTKEYYHLPDTPEEIMDEWLSMARDAYANRCPLKPGVLDFLSVSRAEGIPMAIVTACMPLLCEAALNRFGIRGWFRFILYAQELNLQKTDPRVWAAAIERTGQAPAQCVVFDDSPRSCQAAGLAGCRTVGVYDALYAASRAGMERDCLYYISDFRDVNPRDFA